MVVGLGVSRFRASGQVQEEPATNMSEKNRLLGSRPTTSASEQREFEDPEGGIPNSPESQRKHSVRPATDHPARPRFGPRQGFVSLTKKCSRSAVQRFVWNSVDKLGFEILSCCGNLKVSQ